MWVMYKATAIWQWSAKYTSECGRLGKRPLWINVDESPCPLQLNLSGNLIRDRCPFRGRYLNPRQPCLRRESKMMFTLVALVCSDTTLQTKLPQVIICCKHSLSQANALLLEDELPDNVFLLRRETHWNSAKDFEHLIRVLGLVLAQHVPANWQPIFMMDCAKIHLQGNVFEALQDNGIWPLVVPARLTWLLQPLDTAGFHKFKMYVRRLAANFFDPNGVEKPVVSMVRYVVEAIRKVLQGTRWASVFEANGFGNVDGDLTTMIKTELRVRCMPLVHPALPSERALKVMWPRGMPVHPNLMHALPPLPAALALPAPAAPLALAPPPPALAGAPIDVDDDEAAHPPAIAPVAPAPGVGVHPSAGRRFVRKRSGLT